MNSWLSKARKLRGITAKQLAEATGVSLNYIQQIESGRRHPSDVVAEAITQYLGFNQDEIAFDSETLLNKLDDIEAVSGANAFCFCKLHPVGCKNYIVDVLAVRATDSLSNPPDQCEPIRVKYARKSIHAQMVLYEDFAEKELERIGASIAPCSLIPPETTDRKGQQTMPPIKKSNLWLKWLENMQVPSNVKLYHYTDKTGYEGIRSSSAFRIRHLTALDDQEEGSIGIILLDRLLQDYGISNRGANCLKTVLDSYIETFGFCKNPNKNIEQTLAVEDTDVTAFDRFNKHRIFELSLTDQAQSAFHIENYTAGDGYAFEMGNDLTSLLVVEKNARNPKTYKSIERPLTHPQADTPPFRTIYGQAELQQQLADVVSAINETIEEIEYDGTLQLSLKGEGYPKYACCWNDPNSPTVKSFNESLELTLLLLACLYKSENYRPEAEIRILVVLPDSSRVSIGNTTAASGSFDCIFLEFPENFGCWHQWSDTNNSLLE